MKHRICPADFSDVDEEEEKEKWRFSISFRKVTLEDEDVDTDISFGVKDQTNPPVAIKSQKTKKIILLWVIQYLQV